MIRKSTVTAGNTDWSASAGTNTDDSEWLVHLPPTNTYTPVTLGSHPHTDLEAQDNSLFFSEYAEGSEGSNKYVEIYNGTGSSVDLSDYQVWGSNNGSDWKPERQHDLTGTLSDGDVYVIAADAASQAILDATDLALAYESALHYNGDDAIGLAKDNGTGTF